MTDRGIDYELIERDRQTFSALHACEVGAPIFNDLLVEQAQWAESWRNMGFVAQDQDNSVKAVDLTSQEALVGIGDRTFRSLSAIAIISINKSSAGRPIYLYDTLKSLFDNLPERAQVNVLVGDSDSGYVSSAVLSEAIGTQRAARVHIHTTSPAQAEFLAQNFELYGRATWNYARALRAHRGPGALLLLEDDVKLANDAPQLIDALWATSALHLASVYNASCGEYPKTTLPADGRVTILEPDYTRAGFALTQAMVFDSEVSQKLGQFLHLRLHQRAYDHLIDGFIRAHGLQMGSFYPSLVQHTGTISTGLAGFGHRSACFADDM